MIRQWLELDGTYARFDTISKIIEYVDADGVNVVPTHQATEDELARVAELFPEVSVEVQTRKAAMASQLLSTLNALRTATADQVITPAEFAGLNPSVVATLTAYRDYPDSDPEIDKMVILLLTQINFAYSMLLAQGAKASSDLRDYVLEVEQDLNDIRQLLADNNIA